VLWLIARENDTSFLLIIVEILIHFLFFYSETFSPKINTYGARKEAMSVKTIKPLSRSKSISCNSSLS